MSTKNIKILPDVEYLRNKIDEVEQQLKTEIALRIKLELRVYQLQLENRRKQNRLNKIYAMIGEKSYEENIRLTPTN